MRRVHLPKEINGLEQGSCVTIGNFDGVHVGHQHLIQRMRQRAHKLQIPAVLITFEPHPLRFFTGAMTPPLLTTLECKAELVEALEIDIFLCLSFTNALASMSPESFVCEILVKALRVRELFIGHDYAFGKGRQGNHALLSALGQEYDFAVEQLDPVLIEGVVVSSTRVRDLLLAGDVWAASALLGRFYALQGEIVRGQNRGGRLLGFPTANLALSEELVPATGVYCCRAGIGGHFYEGVANVGYNPTFSNAELSVEVHLFDTDQDLYGQQMRVFFVQRLRGERKFAGLDALQEQIAKDSLLARKILSTPESRL